MSQEIILNADNKLGMSLCSANAATLKKLNVSEDSCLKKVLFRFIRLELTPE